MRRRVSDQSGVAMVTVLFTAAVLTVVSSTAAFVTIQEFRSAGNDQRGAQALAYAEAGIDQLMLLIRGDTWKWGQLNRSGCDDEDGNGIATDDDDDDAPFGTAPGADLVFVQATVAGTNGVYRAILRHPDCPNPIPSPRNPQRMSIFSEGNHPAARRVVEQVTEFRPKGLPVGLYAESSVSSGGVGNEAEVQRVSLVTPGNIVNRDRIGFEGVDPYYTQNDFYGVGPAAAIPSAAHAGGDIFCKFPKKNCSDEAREHFGADPDMNCLANELGTSGQSAWDGSANGGALDPLTPTCAGYSGGKPPTSKFVWDAATKSRVAPSPSLEPDDLRALRTRATASGLYCNYKQASPVLGLAAPWCTVAGGSEENAPSVFTTGFVKKAGLPMHFVAYFDFATVSPGPAADANLIDWRVQITPVCGPPASSQSIVMLIPNGSITIRGAGAAGSASEVGGAIFAEKGTVDVSSGVRIHGTIISRVLNMQAGASFRLDECWLEQMPIAFIRVIPISWAEIDS